MQKKKTATEKQAVHNHTVKDRCPRCQKVISAAHNLSSEVATWIDLGEELNFQSPEYRRLIRRRSEFEAEWSVSQDD